MLSNLTQDHIKDKLKSFYQDRYYLPRLFEDLEPQNIESTYTNLLFIKREKRKRCEDADTQLKESMYGSYEGIQGKKTEIELTSIFEKGNKVIIYGKAGVGKTTLCHHIGFKCMNGNLWSNKFDYVFQLSLRELINREWKNFYEGTELRLTPLECFIDHCCLGLSEEIKLKNLKLLLDKERVLIILDGYDEIAHLHKSNNDLIGRILDKAMGIKNPRAMVIMTSRPNAVTESLKAKFDAEMENIGLTIKDVYIYIDKFKFKEHSKNIELKQFIRSHRYLEIIAQVPINLYLLCIAWNEGTLQKEDSITSTILYQKITYSLMRRYLEKFKEMQTSNMYEHEIERECQNLCSVLEEIAYLSVQNKCVIIDKELLCKVVSVGKVLEELSRKLGFISTIGEEEGKELELINRSHEFIHLTFQEYFAARHIVKALKSNNLENITEVCVFLKEKKYEPAYEQVFLFVSGLVISGSGNSKVISYFWNIILNGNTDLNIKYQIQLIISCLEEGKCNERIPSLNRLISNIKNKKLLEFNWFIECLNRNQQVLSKSELSWALIKELIAENTTEYALSIFSKLSITDIKIQEKLVIALIPLFKNDKYRKKALMILTRLTLSDLKLKEYLTAPLLLPLLNLIKDDDAWVRKNAVIELSKLKSIEEIVYELLSPILEGKNDQIPLKAAVEALDVFDWKVAFSESGIMLFKPIPKKKEEKLDFNSLDQEDRDKLAKNLLCELKDAKVFEFMKQQQIITMLGKLHVTSLELQREIALALIPSIGFLFCFGKHGTVKVLENLNITNVELQEELANKLAPLLNDSNTCDIALEALEKLNITDIDLQKRVVLPMLDNDRVWVRAKAIKILRQLGVYVEPKLYEQTISELLRRLEQDTGDPNLCANTFVMLKNISEDNIDYTQIIVSNFLDILFSPQLGKKIIAIKGLSSFYIGSSELQSKVAKELMFIINDPINPARHEAYEALLRLDIQYTYILKNITEELMCCAVTNRSYQYLRIITSKYIERCGSVGIILKMTSELIPLLTLGVFVNSAVVISNKTLVLYNKSLQIMLELDSNDIELPRKIVEYYQQRAKEKGLPTEMIMGLRVGRRWVEVGAIEPEIEEVIRNNKIGGLEMKEIVQIELGLVTDFVDKEQYIRDLLQVCGSAAKISALKEKYSGQKASPILVIAMGLAIPSSENREQLKEVSNNPEYVIILRKVIKELSQEGIGMKFKDEKGNTVAHYAVKYWYKELGEIVLQDSLYKSANKCGATIVHAAVLYGSRCVKGVYSSIGKTNLNFRGKAKLGEWEFTPLELAVVLGELNVIKEICDITKKVPATNLEQCGSNILNLATKFGRCDVLHHLLYNYKIEEGLVQEAFVFASVVGDKGNIEALRIIQHSFSKKYKDCSIKGCNNAGNTAIHEVAEKQGMRRKAKEAVINYLLEQDPDLLNLFNGRSDKQLPRDLAKKEKLRDFLDGKKGQIDDNRYKIPEIGETPIRNLVLKGGGPKAIVYIGALKKWEQIQREKALGEIERVAGTSAGAITAGLYALGYTGEELEKDLASINVMSFLDNENIDKMLEEYRSDGGVLEKVKALKQRGANGERMIFDIIDALGSKRGLCSGDKFEEIIGGLIQKKTEDRNFTLGDLNKAVSSEKSCKKLCIVTLDINKEKPQLVVLSSDNPSHRNIRVLDAIRAAMGIPIVFAPKEISYFDMETGEEVRLKCIDGGILYNYPLDIFDMAQYQSVEGRGSQMPMYNPYTLGLSICDEEVNKEVREQGEVATNRTIYGRLLDVCIWMAGGSSAEVRGSGGNIIEHVKKIVGAIYNAELVRNEYWKVSEEKRTIEMGCLGIGLLDFDLSPEKIKELIAEGEKAVEEAFNPEKPRSKAKDKKDGREQKTDSVTQKLPIGAPNQQPKPITRTAPTSWLSPQQTVLLVGGIAAIGITVASNRGAGRECTLF